MRFCKIPCIHESDKYLHIKFHKKIPDKISDNVG